jgi:HicB family
MQLNPKRSAPSKFPLRLMPSVRKGAEVFSQREGVSLNQFINIAIAEKLAHLQHDEWLARRPQPTAARISRALQLLDRPSRGALAPADELPAGYVSIRSTARYRRAAESK